MSRSNYDKFPKISVPNSGGKCVAGWQDCAARLNAAISRRNAQRTVLVVECYPGVNEAEIIGELTARLKPALVVRPGEAMLESAAIETLVAPFLGGNDPVFGFLSGLTLPQFFDRKKIELLRSQLAAAKTGLILVVGCGARFLTDGDILMYADLPRWEAQNRFRRNETANLGADNRLSAASAQYKRAFFVDWRVADRWKRQLMHVWDFVLDTTKANEPRLAEGEAVRDALRHAVTRPFRVVPFFDPAPWGGQWMRKTCDLDGAAPNYGWCFDCVPEENSLLLEFGNVTMEIPSINVVFFQPRELLGESVHARFGDEFPIRFDFLDTMGGGNLSFQVHPLTEYIQHHFGMHYTQDESYYMLEAGPAAHVFLGLREKVDRQAMIQDLRKAQAGGFEFPADKYVNRFPARKHDHFLIPAGTVHCSGADSMVLEISATPYIFTFKMWDWGRLGLDGKPRPIHLDHGIANIQWDRDADWTRKNLVNRFSPLGSGDGWREERTGLHEREFIETRRHWFTKAVPHHTHGGVNVLNLVEGTEAVVESVEGRFEPFVIRYAETFIVPAAVGPYTIRPLGTAANPLGTLKAYVRESAVIAPLRTSVAHNTASVSAKTNLQPVS
ncbi:MAG TPA: class I mannose-6-phosphate isomerase [Verrucomicrobiae bacterium]|jgi:mannose-6-phosphate isomerase class I|nr:class I mannose-6-phosphate isomerase [Verrucomicrobiae bacterium]